MLNDEHVDTVDLGRLVKSLCALNVLLVVPVGNDGSDRLKAPANIATIADEDCMIRVGALTVSKPGIYMRHKHSNWDTNLKTIMAPGHMIPTHSPNSDDVVFVSGTCPASAIVAGTLALMRSCDPTYTAKNLHKILHDNSKHENIGELNDAIVLDIRGAVSAACIDDRD